MILSQSATNADKLVDEQNIAGDPLNNTGGSPTSEWHPGWGPLYPASAYIDLGQTTDLTHLYLYDYFGIGTFNVYAGTSPSNYDATPFYSNALTLYEEWVGGAISINTRYLKFEMTTADGRIGEVRLYKAAGSNNPPVLNAISNVSMNGGSSQNVALNATDPDSGDVLNLSMSGAPSFASLADNGDGSGTITLSPSTSDVGTYSISVTASDNNGGTDTKSFTVSVTSPNSAPTIAAISNLTVAEGNSQNVAVSASDPDPGDVLILTSNENLSFVNFTDNGNGSGTFAINPTSGDAGSYTINVTATDNQGASDSESFTLTVNSPPSGNGIITLNTGMILNTSAPNAGNLVDEQSIAGDPLNNAGGSPTNGWFPGWGPFYPAYAYIDLGTVTNLTHLYLYDYFGVGTFNVYAGTSPSNYNATPFYSNGLTLYEEWVGGAISVNTRYLKFEMTSANGQVGEIRLYEGSGGNNPPSISAIGDFTLVESNSQSVTATASDPDGDVLTLTASGTPSFASFVDNNNGTGTFNFSPQLGDAGSYPISVSASDGNGGTDTESFVLTVSSAPPSGQEEIISIDCATMVFDENNSGACNLFDEPIEAGDPAAGNGGAPITEWCPGCGQSSPETYYPAYAYVDFGVPTTFTKVFIRDLNGEGVFAVYTGSPGAWDMNNPVMVTNLTGYQSWTEKDIPVTSRYLRFEVREFDAHLSELVIYGLSGNADATPPSAISNLSASANNNSSIELTWTATGDDGSTGTANSYELRYSSNPITATNFSSATLVNTSAPQTSGASESITVTGLSCEQLYYFAIEAIDEAGNRSGLSNVANATTTTCGTGGPLSMIIHFDGPPSNFQINPTKLKYNKDFAYSLTMDDADIGHFTNIFPMLNGGTSAVGGSETGFFYTDACGNNIPFRAGLAINGNTLNNAGSQNFDWSDLQTMFDAGWDVFNHSFDHCAYSACDYVAQVVDNTNAIQNNIGFQTTHFVVASGDYNGYRNPAFANGMVALYDQKYFLPGHPDGLEISNALSAGDFELYRWYLEDSSPPYGDKIDNAANNSTGGNHYWFNEFTHIIGSSGPIGINNFRTYMQYIEDTYGQNGSDRIWVAPLQEVYEYLQVRDNIQLSHTVAGNDVTVSFDLSAIPPDLRQEALSLAVSANANISSIEVFGADEYCLGQTGGTDLINLSWSGGTNGVVNYPTLGPNDTGLKIVPSNSLHPATSYIIGTNRNHVEVPYAGAPNNNENIAGKLAKYGGINPVFGEQKKIYRIGHGPTDGRFDYADYTGYQFQLEWGQGGPYPYDDLRYALADAEALNAEITMVVNYGTGTAADAGALVSYLNDANNYLRVVEHQHPEPYNVKFFEVGNEVTWDAVRGHDPHALSPTIYANRAKDFITQMRANSDIPIEIGMVGSTNCNWQANDWPNDESNDIIHNLDPIMDILKDDVDFIIYHGYPNWPVINPGLGYDRPIDYVSQSQWIRDKLENQVIPTLVAGSIRNGLSDTIKLANTEYHSEFDHSMANMTIEAMYTAESMITALTFKELIMAVNFCFSHDATPPPGDPWTTYVDNLFFYEADPNKTTNVFDVHKMVAENLGDDVIETIGQNLPTTPLSQLNPVMERDLENLSYVATKASNGQVALLIVNRMDYDITIPVDPGFSVNAASLHSLAGGTYEDPSINTSPMTMSVTSLTDLNQVTLPAASVNILLLD